VPCSFWIRTRVSGGTSIAMWVSIPTSLLCSSSRRLVVTRSVVPCRVRLGTSLTAISRAFSSVGRNTTLRRRSLTWPGSPFHTRTSPKAFSTLSTSSAGTPLRVSSVSKL
jgi:hypothetical protein